MKKLFLIDTFAFVFRSYYAIPPMTSPDKVPTNALYGFVSMVIKILREHNPEYVVFCFDRSDGSFRNELYPEYKANRGDMPDDLVPQIPYLRKILESMGLYHIDKKGFEADDVIGTLSYMGSEKGLDVSIISSDKDFAQLVGPQIKLFDPMRDNLYDEQGVVDKWGVYPNQMIDYLAICGDSSDNVPGVKGIGPKGAQKLLAEYKDLEGVYENIEKITAKSMKAKLQENEDMAYLSKELVTIATNIEFSESIEDFKPKKIDREKVVALFQELGFKSFEKKLFAMNEPRPEAKSKKVLSKNNVKVDLEVCDIQKASEYLKPYSEVYAIQTSRDLLFQVDKKLIQVDGDYKELGKLLEGKHLRWKGFDLKSIWRSLDLTNVSIPLWDQMLAAYTLNPSNISSFEKLYEQYTEDKLPDLISEIDLFNAHLTLKQHLEEALQEKECTEIYEKFELALVPVLYSMERNGILLDLDFLSLQSKSLEKDLSRLEKEIHDEAGEVFNVASPKQLGAILFEKLKLPIIKKGKTGYSTSVDVLKKLSSEYPICSKVIEYRELAKLRNTYVDALPELVDQDSKRIHTQFRQAVTTTGRLSSQNPNLQNIPIRTERGRLVRKAFVVPEGKVLLSVDYSQIELRVLAHITNDPGLRKAFLDGKDIHSATASEVFAVPIEEVTVKMRRAAKAVNFGIAYGQGPFGLSEALSIPRAEAKEIIDKYFEKFKNVKDYMESTVEKAKEDGYVSTLIGRKRYIKELQSRNGMLRKFGERAAINAPIQGTASDIVKLAMVEVFNNVEAPMLLQVHDELLFECDESEVDENIKLITKIMENTTKLNVPLVVNCSYGKNWDEAH